MASLPKRKRVSIDCSVEPSMTKQSFKAECDINNIMTKYERTGLIDFSDRLKSGKYADLASMPDYHTALNKVAAAQEAFDALPSKVRATFDNDPALFLQFVSDPKNLDKAIELGLAKPKAAPIAASAASAAPSSTPEGAGAPKAP